MTDPTIVMAMLSAAESALNSFLERDPVVYKRLLQLHGKVLRVELTDLKLEFFLLINDNGIRLLNHYEGEQQSSLSASSNAIVQLIIDQDVTRALHSDGIRIEGNIGMIIELQQIARLYQFDREALLANVFGDVVAHKLHQGLLDLGSWLHNSSDVLQQNISEYLQEELHLLPSSNEIASFANDLQQTTLDLDRLEARVQKLQQRIINNPQSDQHKD